MSSSTDAVRRDFPVHGAGLGLRRPHLGSLLEAIPEPISFMEVAPENWIGAGGRIGEAFEKIVARTDLVCHGLLLNLGGPDPLDVPYIKRIGEFCKRYGAKCYGDHLTFCAESGQLYELLPMPFTLEAADHLASRIMQVQDILGERIVVENPSYYVALSQEISELEFTQRIFEKADCRFLIDINNIYVNSQNYGFDPVEFLKQLPADRIAYAHIAGHFRDPDGVIVDTHGTDVIDPVWELLESAYGIFGVFPTLLERDEHIPSLDTVVKEVARIHEIQQRCGGRAAS